MPSMAAASSTDSSRSGAAGTDAASARTASASASISSAIAAWTRGLIGQSGCRIGAARA
jgi:hypothetical protein